MILSYKIHNVAPYINWIYFFHAWGFQPRFAAIANIHGCIASEALLRSSSGKVVSHEARQTSQP